MANVPCKSSNIGFNFVEVLFLDDVVGVPVCCSNPTSFSNLKGTRMKVHFNNFLPSLFDYFPNIVNNALVNGLVDDYLSLKFPPYQYLPHEFDDFFQTFQDSDSLLDINGSSNVSLYCFNAFFFLLLGQMEKISPYCFLHLLNSLNLCQFLFLLQKTHDVSVDFVDSFFLFLLFLHVVMSHEQRSNEVALMI